ncbi:MAG TPA: restriction endonuclease subunit S [Thermoanaerobaculia bacterium]
MTTEPLRGPEASETNELSISEKERPLPKGWTWHTVGEMVLKAQYGTSAKTSVKAGIPVLRMGNIRDGELVLDSLKHLPVSHREFPALLLEKGDVLFNRTNSAELVGKSAVYRGNPSPCSFASYLIRLRVKPGFVPEFLAWYINSPFGRAWIASVVSQQVGQANVNGTKLRNLRVPVPSHSEQQRIVAEIEKHFSRLDTAESALKRARASLNLYRSAVLNAACAGELVRTEADLAQEEGRDFESADELLTRILSERRSKWERHRYEVIELDASSDVHRQRISGRYKSPDSPDVNHLHALPKGWAWSELGQLSWSVKDGPHYSPKYAVEGIPFITGGNVRPSGVDFVNAKRISPQLHIQLSKRCKPELGDILYTKGGTTGIARVNSYKEEFSVWVHVAVLKLVDSIDRFFVQHALNSPFCYSQAQKFTHGVGNQDLGLTRMIRIAIPLPPLAEQQRIVAEVERRLSVIDRLETFVDTNLLRAKNLRQSILHRAFSGNL